MFKKTLFISCFLMMLFCASITGQKLIKKAELQTANGDFDLAIESYKKYLTDNPSDINVLAKLADTYAVSGNFMEAVTLFESLPANANLDPNLYKNYGDALKKWGATANQKFNIRHFGCIIRWQQIIVWKATNLL
ncbi:MAG: tetratricopeptide repeat protein [Saprospiraceae bacterium]|nr:tetratricopeptide repeat protein [Saprospiraceae bacterium]